MCNLEWKDFRFLRGITAEMPAMPYGPRLAYTNNAQHGFLRWGRVARLSQPRPSMGDKPGMLGVDGTVGSGAQRAKGREVTTCEKQPESRDEKEQDNSGRCLFWGVIL